jgi:hypothetical protein
MFGDYYILCIIANLGTSTSEVDFLGDAKLEVDNYIDIFFLTTIKSPLNTCWIM